MPFPPTPSITASPTPTPSITPSVTPTNTPTSSVCPGLTPTATSTPPSSPTQTNTPTQTITSTPTITPTQTSTAATPTQTPTPSSTPASCLCYYILNETAGVLQYTYTPCGTGLPTTLSLTGGANTRVCSEVLPTGDPGMTIVPCVSITNCTDDSDCVGCSF